MARHAPGLESLPDDLLGACLSYLSQQDGQYVTLVSRRFQRLFYQQSSLWRSFTVHVRQPRTRERLEARLALLRRVAPHVTAFAVLPANERQGITLDGSNGQPRLIDLLQPLPPSLTALELGNEGLPLQLPPQTARLLQPFTAVRSLNLQILADAGDLVAVVQLMPKLEELSCSMQHCPDLQQLTRLTQLRHLYLRDSGSAGGGVRPPTLSALPQLEEFQLHSWSGRVELADTHCMSCSLGPVEFDGAREPVVTLAIRNAELGSLQLLLAAAVRSTLVLEALDFEDVTFSAASLQGCTQLTGVQSLRLFDCQFDAPAAAALFACCQELNGLDLIDWDGPGIELNDLQLPPQLKRLCLADYSYKLPGTLAQLTNLQCLDVSNKDELELSLETVELLCRLPALRELGLPGIDPEDLDFEEEEDEADSALEAAREAVQELLRRRPGLRIWYVHEPYL
ncbi:leucine rich repeat domain containing [Chlorella sorokiniana]|uniref:Leucine rich repeat domain containing n=1 Tax=Chlorella sorokiniana TaxID=3076 RepID=A0A2P6TB78_CHLSO|nr:leucine rich repeat domain containing [Chlorella sorokiniana]|eukprot:PRW05801.1 leucine rich repeat domain containing [Chlorella sorokiniana]